MTEGAGPALVIVVDPDRCTGIGICESIAPEYFEVGDDGALVLLRDVCSDTDRDEVETAVRSCPAKALRIERIPMTDAS